MTKCHNLFNLDFNDRTSSIVVPHCALIFDDVCCQGKSHKIYQSLDNLANINFDDKLTSIRPCGEFNSDFPHQIHESWSGHEQIMTKVAEGQDIAIYYNDDVQRGALRSHSEYIRKLWKHVKNTYGDFGPQSGRLYAFFHANVPTSTPAYSTNSIQTYFDMQSECRNVLDFVGRMETSWSRSMFNGTSKDLDAVTQEMAHLVEFSSKGVHGSPTFQLWGEGPWKEIFTFDAYYSLGLQNEKQRWFLAAYNSKYDYPKYDTYWFRDWFYPVYKHYGGGALLSKYFELLAKHYPRKDAMMWEYKRDLNLGEFVHFFSGAAQVDLKSHAARAFRWTHDDERELLRARNDFPQIWY